MSPETESKLELKTIVATELVRRARGEAYNRDRLTSAAQSLFGIKIAPQDTAVPIPCGTPVALVERILANDPEIAAELRDALGPALRLSNLPPLPEASRPSKRITIFLPVFSR